MQSCGLAVQRSECHAVIEFLLPTLCSLLSIICSTLRYLPYPLFTIHFSLFTMLYALSGSSLSSLQSGSLLKTPTGCFLNARTSTGQFLNARPSFAFRHSTFAFRLLTFDLITPYTTSATTNVEPPINIISSSPATLPAASSALATEG